MLDLIKLLAVDMDGTCLNRKHMISDETMKALRAVTEAGIILVPTTGRTATCLPRQLLEAPFFRYAISSNGAVAVDLETKVCLHQAYIPYETAARVLKACEREKLGISAHLDHEFDVQGRGLFLLGKLCYRKDARNVRCKQSILKLLDGGESRIEELQIFFFSKEKEQRARWIFDQESDLIASYSGCYTEVYAANASKGNALTALAHNLGISKEEIACIGDAENDLSMFEASGLRFSMGNGIDALKERADVVLPGNDEDGVAVAIRKYLLSEQR